MTASFSKAQPEAKKPTNLTLNEKLRKILKFLRPQGYLNLCAIEPDGPIKARTFTMPGQLSSCVEFIKTQNQAGKNIYWTVNPVKNRLSRKPTKADIKSVEWVHVDIDPDLKNGYENGRQALLAQIDSLDDHYQPTILIDSGHGLQLFWRLETSVSQEEGEALNQYAINFLGGDPGTGNVDRLMRMPFTQNYPTQAKLAKGYPDSPMPALVLRASDKNTRESVATFKQFMWPTETPRALQTEDDDIVYPVNPKLWEQGGKKAWKVFLRRNPEIQALWNYETIPDDHSSTLLALLNHLAFYAGNNTQIMRQVFEKSAFCACENIDSKWFNAQHQIEGVQFATYHLRKARQENLWEPQTEMTEITKGGMTPDEFMAWAESLTLTAEEAAALSDPQWVVENLIIQGHLIVFPAEPNAGKTTLLFHLCCQLAKDYKILYINLDIAAADAKTMADQARKAGFQLLLPDMKNASPEDVLTMIENFGKNSTDLSNYIFVIDTLKKFTDVINKSNLKSTLAMFRGLTAKGATVCLLAHTNKHKDSEGLPVFEGTGDLRSDVDELIYLIPVKNDDGTITLSTRLDKVRGTFDPITFILYPDRTVKRQQRYVDTMKQRESLKLKNEYEDVIKCLQRAIKNKQQTQGELIEAGKKEGFSRNKVLKVLNEFTGDAADEPLFNCEVGENNTHYYTDAFDWME